MIAFMPMMCLLLGATAFSPSRKFRLSAQSSSRHDAAPAALNMPEPPVTSPAHALYNLILQNRASGDRNSIPVIGCHDAISAKVFALNGATALFVSGFGVSASLLGVPDAGMTSIVEMEMMARNIRSAVQSSPAITAPPVMIVDGDTGYGGSANMLRTVSSLAASGAAAITIEDQRFPKKCTIAAGSKVQIVDREDAIQRIRAALGARDLYQNQCNSRSPWIIARTDCRMAYWLQEAIERCQRFEELGAEIIYAENLQTKEEYEKLRSTLDPKTVCMVAQVQETTDAREKSEAGGKPLLTTQEIGQLGFDLALFGVTPLQTVIGALEVAAKEIIGTDERAGTGLIRPSQHIPIADFSTVKRFVGFPELEDFETKYPC